MAVLAKTRRDAPLAALLHLLEHAGQIHNIASIGWLADNHLKTATSLEEGLRHT